jgi:hypothetical protein
MFGDDTKAETPEKLVLRAIQCSLVIQSQHRKYDSDQGFVLTLHVGIGIGDMYSLFVGGVDGSWVCEIRVRRGSVVCFTGVLILTIATIGQLYRNSWWSESRSCN